MSFTGSRTESLATADDLPARLALVLAEQTARATAGRRMSPELSYGRHGGPAPITARHAAVMLLLFRRSGRWHLPITERPTSLLRHGGQMSLPGGIVEMGETSEQAALRELQEELGVESTVVVLGQLANCYVFASNFVVTPWLAVAASEPHWLPDAREVQEVIELPLELLLDDNAIGSMNILRGPLVFRAPCYHIAGACIWGATSVILSELADLLHSIGG
ncbi:MAG: CoA pyrophosphatase [Pirellulales bacterium]